MADTNGLVFVAIGEKAADNCRYATDALTQTGNTYPTQIIQGEYAAANKQASRHAKVTLFDQADYDRYVYLDADTRVHTSIKPLFDILADGWDVVIAPSSNQADEVFWHVGEDERRNTLETIGIVPLQLQCGVMAVAKNERTKTLYQNWRSEWMRWSGEDQAAFIRALYAEPVKVWLMGYPWNGGAAINHNFGAIRS